MGLRRAWGGRRGSEARREPAMGKPKVEGEPCSPRTHSQGELPHRLFTGRMRKDFRENLLPGFSSQNFRARFRFYAHPVTVAAPSRVMFVNFTPENGGNLYDFEPFQERASGKISPYLLKNHRPAENISYACFEFCHGRSRKKSPGVIAPARLGRPFTRRRRSKSGVSPPGRAGRKACRSRSARRAVCARPAARG